MRIQYLSSISLLLWQSLFVFRMTSHFAHMEKFSTFRRQQKKSIYSCLQLNCIQANIFSTCSLSLTCSVPLSIAMCSKLIVLFVRNNYQIFSFSFVIFHTHVNTFFLMAEKWIWITHTKLQSFLVRMIVSFKWQSFSFIDFPHNGICGIIAAVDNDVWPKCTTHTVICLFVW